MDDNSSVAADRIIKINIEDEMKSSYIDYSMSVIVSRALPDVRDGFKPVHRRILYGMMGINNVSSQPYKKCARVVGEVLGKYHPHGDSSVYGALVRMAQDWNMRYTLVDGQGNFGSVDGDSPAAMRYTECRLSRMGEHIMDDIKKDTVDMARNFDNTLDEPTVMPSRIPNLLVNGGNGIAVGMATNIPTHNLCEVVAACCAYIDDPTITVDALMRYIPAPDFPTGGFIYGLQGVREAYTTGRGRVVMRAKVEIESGDLHDKIIVSELPYGVNKQLLIENIADLVKDGRLEGITNVNDETGRQGMRIVIDVRRDANANILVNKLFKMTALQSAFSVNTVALVKGRPRLLTLKECIQYFVEHRHEVTLRRTQYDKRKAEERAHLLSALLVACDNIDEVVALIRSSRTPVEAQARLMARFSFDEPQAKYVVEMRLSQLTGLSMSQLHDEYDELQRTIAHLAAILSDDALCRQVMKDELQEVAERYGDSRRTQIIPAEHEFNAEDFYPNSPVIITLSLMGYIKRTALSEYREQSRGGIGSKAVRHRDNDAAALIYPATMHQTLIFFTKLGRCYWLRCFELPEGGRDFRGRAIQNMLNISPDDRVQYILRLRAGALDDAAFINSHYVVFSTKLGTVKKTVLEQYSRPRANGVGAITLVPGDELVDVRLTNGRNELIIATRYGYATRFHESSIRTMGRMATGVRGIRLIANDDAVVGMIVVNDADKETVMVVSTNGYGKRSPVDDYTLRLSRGGKGMKTMNITDKTGQLVAIKNVDDSHDLMIINRSGIAIRLPVATCRVMGRVTQGVRLINLEKKNDVIAAVTKVMGAERAADVEALSRAEWDKSNPLAVDDTTATT